MAQAASFRRWWFIIWTIMESNHSSGRSRHGARTVRCCSSPTCLNPKRAEVRRLFAESYERIALQQSIDLTGDDSFYRDFVNEEWNFFRFPDDDADIPSPLYEQLQWLDAAGYRGC